MKAEARELYVFTKDHFKDDLSRISKDCVAPLMAVRQVVKKAMTKYIEDYCGTGAKFEDVFSEEDFQEVSKKIVDELE
jgi:hypothetical protein